MNLSSSLVYTTLNVLVPELLQASNLLLYPMPVRVGLASAALTISIVISLTDIRPRAWLVNIICCSSTCVSSSCYLNTAPVLAEETFSV